MSWNLKNCGVCGRVNRPHRSRLWDRNFRTWKEPDGLSENWFVKSVCEACAINFFLYLKRTNQFDYYDISTNTEYVFMFWMIRLIRKELDMSANGLYFGYCENVSRYGENCRWHITRCDIATHKLICGSCDPLSITARRALRKEAEERNLKERKRWDDETREETIIKLEKWRKKYVLKKRNESSRFCWLSLPC